MSPSRIFVFLFAAFLAGSVASASVYQTNTTPCTTLQVMIKQYTFYDGNLNSCPTNEASVAYGDTLIINDYSTSWETQNPYPDSGYTTHSYAIQYTVQYTYSVATSCPPPYTVSSTTAAAPVNGRTKIGVGEVVFVTITPTPSSTTWYIPPGTGTLNDQAAGSVTYTAPAVAGNFTLTATVNGNNYTRTFEVVAPSGVYMERNTGLGIFHIQGTPSAGMKTNAYLLPNDVNFSGVEFREETCTPETASGYFSPLSSETHNQGDWVPLSSTYTSGKGTLASVPDSVATWGEYLWTHQAGSYVLRIPWTYRLKIGGGNGYPINPGTYTATHGTTATASGAVTVSKASAIYTANLNDAEGVWYPSGL
jgi:hypothetical protein